MPRLFDDRESDFSEARARRPEAARPLSPLSYRVAARQRSATDRIANETIVLGRRRVDGAITVRHKVETPRPQKPPVSVARPQPKTALRPRVVEPRAKAIAADRRMFNPTGFPKTIYGTFARTVAAPRGRLRFVVPQQVYPCVQRWVRRQVLFAKRRAGAGTSSRSRKRRSSTSHIGC